MDYDPNDPRLSVRLDDLRRSGSPFFRSDANALWFLKELEQMIGEYEIRRPAFPMASGQVLPIRGTVPRGKKTGSYKMYDYTGVAKWMNAGSWKDAPMAGATAERSTFTVEQFGMAYGWDLEELEEAQATGAPLASLSRRAASRANMKFLDDVGMYGDVARGLHGFVNHPNMTVVDAPAGAAGAFRWSTTGATAKTALECKEDVDLAIRTMRSLTEEVQSPNRCWMPSSFWERTTSLVIPGSGQTLRRFLLENFPDIQFRELRGLESAGNYDGPCMVFADLSSPEDLWFEVPMFEEEYPDMSDPMQTKIYMRSRTGGVITPFPQTLLRIDFAAD